MTAPVEKETHTMNVHQPNGVSGWERAAERVEKLRTFSESAGGLLAKSNVPIQTR
jgi:hypothetical protein